MWTTTLALVNRAHRLAERRDLPAPESVEVRSRPTEAGIPPRRELSLTFSTDAALVTWADTLGISLDHSSGKVVTTEGTRGRTMFGTAVEFEGVVVQLTSYERAGTWTP